MNIPQCFVRITGSLLQTKTLRDWLSPLGGALTVGTCVRTCL